MSFQGARWEGERVLEAALLEAKLKDAGFLEAKPKDAGFLLWAMGSH